MSPSNIGYQTSRALFLTLGLIACSTGFARGGGDFHAGGGGGGYHQGDIGNGGYHQDDVGNGDFHQDDGGNGVYNHDNVGVGDDNLNDNGAFNHNDDEYNHYGNGGYDYIGPNVGNYYPGTGWVDPTVVINPNDDNSNCQTVQNCNDAGTCITQNEDCN